MTRIPAAPSRGASRLALALLASWLAFQPSANADSVPLPIVDDGQYGTDAAAQAVWKPMRGTAPAQTAVLDGRRALRLPCRFQDSQVERASWDRKVKLDLAPFRGIQFELLCRDASPVAYFSVYFQSGAGWYQATFYPESSDRWTTITVDKAEMRPEGNPAGWRQIETIRVSAWRGKDLNTEFYVRDVRLTGVLGADVSVAILRGDTAARRQPNEARSFEQTAEVVARHFQAVDIGCAVLSDLEIKPEQLARARLVVLPYNPVLTEEVESALIQYLKRGGKLLAFYSIPERLRAAMNLKGGRHVKAVPAGQFSAIRFDAGALPGAPHEVRQRSWNIHAVEPVAGASRVLAAWHDDAGQPTGHAAVLATTNSMFMTHTLLADDSTNQQRMVLAMAGALSSEIGRQAADAAIARIGGIASFQTYNEAVKHIGGLTRNNAEAGRALASAGVLRDSALKLAAQGDFVGAGTQAALAHENLLEAYCRVQKPWAGEFRAFWCHSAFGVRGLSWDEAIQRLADNGFTAILPNMLWGGVAFYESKELPVAAAVAQQGDQIRQCLAAARKHGVQVHVWKVNYNLGTAAPKEFVERMRREGRLQSNSRGQDRPWLCPSHPANQKLETDSMIEVVRKYDVDGVHFDYIRYPDGDHCFCAGCRERFERAIGTTLARWPQDVLADGPQRERWLEWRRDNITAVVKAVSEQSRAIKPKLKISAAVFRNWPSDRDSVGQDWKVWCDKGYLDFVCPMDYTPMNQRFENMVTQQVQWAGRTPCYPGIGVSASSSRFGADRAIEQINIARRQRTGGFVIFNYGVRESQELLPKLGLGITRKR